MKESRTVWAWTDDAIELHVTRDSIEDRWSTGQTNEELEEELWRKYSVCVWTCHPDKCSKDYLYTDIYGEEM